MQILQASTVNAKKWRNAPELKQGQEQVKRLQGSKPDTSTSAQCGWCLPSKFQRLLRKFSEYSGIALQEKKNGITSSAIAVAMAKEHSTMTAIRFGKNSLDTLLQYSAG